MNENWFWCCFGLFLLASVIAWPVWIAVGVRAWLRRGSDAPVPPLTPRIALSDLEAARASTDPVAALDMLIARLRAVAARTEAPPPLPLPGRLTTTAEANEGTPRPFPLPERALDWSGAAPPAEPGPMLPSWLRLDAITLLLYLGAALVVISAAVFVASAWEVLPGFVRWALVALLALAFLGVGELFTRWRPVLRRAGETFRNVGLLLIPFVALAFDRFVLGGAGTPLFWLVVGVVLGLFYYTYFRWGSADWVASALAALSMGIVALNVVAALGLDEVWNVVALLVLAWALFAVARAAYRAPEREGGRGLGAPLVLTHVIVGAFAWAIGLAAALAFYSDLPQRDAFPRVALLLYGALSVGLFVWLAWALRVALPLFGAGMAAAAMVPLLFPGSPLEEARWYPLTIMGWSVLAVGALALAPLAERWRRFGYPTLAATGLVIALFAFSLAAEYGLEGWLAWAAALIAGLFVVVAWRYRTGLFVIAAIVAGHVALLAFLSWLDLPVGSRLPLSALWTALAGAWLALRAWRGLPTWLRLTMEGAFVAEALWAALYALGEARAMLLIALPLALLWLAWGHLRRTPLAVAPATLLVLYGVGALGALVPMPWLAPPLLLAVLGVGVAALAPRLPAYVREAARWSGVALAAAAGFAGFSVDEPRWTLDIGPARAGVIALALGGLGHGLLGGLRRDRQLVAAAGALLYGALAWGMAQEGVEGTQWYTAPLAALLFGYALLFPRLRLGFEGAAVALLIFPAMADALSDRFLYTAILAAWGLALLAVGIVRGRRLLTVGGAAALLVAALRQLWALITVLPPGLALGLVGLLLMVVAVVLTLRRDALLRALRGD